jgi:hypothetical protein
VAAILTVPIAIAAIVLCVAAVAKLRSPAGAVRALATAGWSVPRGAVRVLAAGEAALAALVLLIPGRISAGLLAATYASLALVAGALARRGAGCGCFGDEGAPATMTHVVLSIAIALVACAGVRWPPHGVAWLLTGTPAVVAPLVLGVAGAAYATVIAYTELPAAWGAWRPR